MRDVRAKIRGVWTFEEVVDKKTKNGALTEALKKNTIWTLCFVFFLPRGPRMSKHLKNLHAPCAHEHLRCQKLSELFDFFTIF